MEKKNNNFQLKNIVSLFFTNRSTKQTIIKNTFWLSLSLFLSKVIKYFLIIYAARILGAQEYGTFNFAMSFSALFYIFADLGISSLISREIARNREEEVNISAGFTLKTVLTFLTFLLIIIASFFVPHTEKIKTTIWLMAIFTLVNGMTNYFYNCFYGREEMQYQTITEVIEASVATFLGLYLIYHLPKAYILSFAYVISALCAFIVILPIFKKKFGNVLKLDFNISEWKKILSLAWPITLIWLCFNVLTYTDITFLGFFKLFSQAGYYSASQKIISLLILPANIVITSVFPSITKAAYTDKEKAQRIFNFQNILLSIIILPLVFGGFFLTKGLIYFLYTSSYDPSVLALKILIFVGFFTYFSFVLSNALFIYNYQRKTFWAYFSSALLNIILNSLFIPKWGMYGAGYATLASTIFAFFILYYFSLKFTPLRLLNKQFLKNFLVILINSSLMILILLKYFSSFSFIKQVLIGVVIYGLITLFLWLLRKKLQIFDF